MTVGHSKVMGNFQKKLFSINQVRLFGKLPLTPEQSLWTEQSMCRKKGALAKGKGVLGWTGKGQWWRLTKPSICGGMFKHSAQSLNRSTPSFRLATIDCVPEKATESKSRCSFATSCQSYIQLLQEKSWAVAGLRVRDEMDTHWPHEKWQVCAPMLATLAQVYTVDGFLHSFVRSSSATVHYSLLNT